MFNRLLKPIVIIQLYLFIVSYFYNSDVNALDTIELSCQQLNMQNWRLQQLQIQLLQLQHTPILQLSIGQLNLPQPFHDIQLVKIRCSFFTWTKNTLNCQRGEGELHSKQFQSPRFQFSFQISPTHSAIHIEKLRLMDGIINMQAQLQQQQQWQLDLKAQGLSLKILQQLFFPQLKLTSSQIGLQAQLHGQKQQLQKIKLDLDTEQLSLQTADGTKASENLALNLHLIAKQINQRWLWENNLQIQQGHLYIDPLYIEITHLPIELQTQGYWNPKQSTIELNSAHFQHPNIGVIKAQAIIQTQPLHIKQAHIYLSIPELNTASSIYLQPFIQAGQFDGIALSGHLESHFKIQDQTLIQADMNSKQFGIHDPQQRFNLSKGVLSLHWTNRDQALTHSSFAWQQFTLFKLPLESSYFLFDFHQQHIHLVDKTTIPLLNGRVLIQQFDWLKLENQTPKIQFSAQLRHISLKLLGQALNWQKPPLGNINGQIPNVTLSNGKLTLGGELKMALFNGFIVFKKLAISGFMTDFTQFYADIMLHHLDLNAITQRFSFGSIQGNISGYIKELYLENWQPIHFNAWLGTPDDDHSTHKISQKAVENLATIGGGGAIDFISRTILTLFDNFSYDKIGFGCYLHHNVCLLTGVETNDYGYYIVKGGGLPRIDVMGYNPRIDWTILQERLHRITVSNKAVSGSP